MASTKHDVEVAPELAALNLVDKPDGPGAAAFLAAGIGVFLMGLMTVLAEATATFHDLFGKLAGDTNVGPLAGKVYFAIGGFVLVWIGLHMAWKEKDVDLKKMFWIGLFLGVIGALLTFPPVFLLFA